MTTLAFVIWVIGWPTACEITSAYSYKCGKRYDKGVRGAAALLEMVIWFVIAALLWRNR